MESRAREQPSLGASSKSSDNALRRFDETGTRLALPGRAMIFEESQCSNQVFVIRGGRVKLFSTSREGRKMIIRVAGPGDILGLNAGRLTTTQTERSENQGPGGCPGKKRTESRAVFRLRRSSYKARHNDRGSKSIVWQNTSGCL